MLFKRIFITTAIFLCFILSGCLYNQVVKQNKTTEQNDFVGEEEFMETFFNVEKKDDFIVAMWVSYLDIKSLLGDMSRRDFEQNLDELILNIKSIGVTDVYFHVRAFGEALYTSKIVPSAFGTTYSVKPNQDDYFKIAIDKFKQNDIKTHAWLNPFRLSDSENLAEYINSVKINYGDIITEYEGRPFINPSSEKSEQLLSEIVIEIIQNYNVDGIHIDDYFYPTTDVEFDSKFFDQNSSSITVDDFRRGRIQSIIDRIYSDIKRFDQTIEFGISPDGSIERNYNTHYLDIEQMQAVAKYADYFVPQLYYGFQNEALPFEKTLEEWQNIVKTKDLIVGIAGYKIGTVDEFAGIGKSEWKIYNDVIGRQIELIKQKGLAGVAFFRYDSLFNPDITVEKEVVEALNIVKEKIVYE